MNYEKKYKEALEIARKINSGEGVAAPPDWTSYEVIFPELKESEDERIRKWCISHFNACINVIKDNDEYKEYLSNKVIAWLEKQGNNKTLDADKVIAWLVGNICDYEYYVKWFKKDFGLC